MKWHELLLTLFKLFYSVNNFMAGLLLWFIDVSLVFCTTVYQFIIFLSDVFFHFWNRGEDGASELLPVRPQRCSNSCLLPAHRRHTACLDTRIYSWRMYNFKSKMPVGFVRLVCVYIGCSESECNQRQSDESLLKFSSMYAQSNQYII